MLDLLDSSNDRLMDSFLSVVSMCRVTWSAEIPRRVSISISNPEVLLDLHLSYSVVSGHMPSHATTFSTSCFAYPHDRQFHVGGSSHMSQNNSPVLHRLSLAS